MLREVSVSGDLTVLSFDVICLITYFVFVYLFVTLLLFFFTSLLLILFYILRTETRKSERAN